MPAVGRKRGLADSAAHVGATGDDSRRTIKTDYGFDRLNPIEAELPGVDGLDEGGLWHDASPEVGQQEIDGPVSSRDGDLQE